MSFNEYSDFDALGLAELVRRGEVSPQELFEEAVLRIERVNPRLNAVVTPMYDEARSQLLSQAPQGPFHGVPFLLKDLVEAYAGVPLTMGSRICSNFTPKRDSELVRRFKRAGVVIIGKTNVPEFGLTVVTESRLLGPCRNPWNVKHSSGGSSGGSAAAVAAGIVPIASANDGGGSIRIPASFCGLVGLKPTRGRTPCGPDRGEEWQGAAVSHILSRSVRDCAAMLDAVAGGEPGPMYASPGGAGFLREVSADPGKLRIAFSSSSPLGFGVHRENVRAVETTARLLADLGHEVVESAPAIDGRQLADSFLCVVFAETAALLRELSRRAGRRLTGRDVEAPTLLMGELGRVLSAADLSAARRGWGQFARIMGRFHEDFHLFLTPVTATPGFEIGELDSGRLERALMAVVPRLRLGRAVRASGALDQMIERVLSKAPFTQLANMTGQPAISLPLHWTADGLPVGVQFTAPFGEEATLFRLAAQLEAAEPWRDRRPPVWAE